MPPAVVIATCEETLTGPVALETADEKVFTFNTRARISKLGHPKFTARGNNGIDGEGLPPTRRFSAIRATPMRLYSRTLPSGLGLVFGHWLKAFGTVEKRTRRTLAPGNTLVGGAFSKMCWSWPTRQANAGNGTIASPSAARGMR